MDFRNVTRLFYDEAFDGPPIQIYEPGPDDPPVPPEEPGDGEPFEDEMDGGDDVIVDPPTPGGRQKYYVQDVEVQILAERVQYYAADGNLKTVSFKEFSRDNLRRQYASLDDFVGKWDAAERKQVVLEELVEQGFMLEELQDQVGGEHLDPFDLICYVAFDRPTMTRSERAKSARKADLFDQYGEQARRVLEALLEKYADEGIEAVEEFQMRSKLNKVLQLPPFNQLGAPVEIVKAFGTVAHFTMAVRQLEQVIYRAA